MLEKILNSKFLAPCGVLFVVACAFLCMGSFLSDHIRMILDNGWNILTFSCYGFAFGIMLCHLSAFQTKQEKIHLGLFLFLFLCAILREAGIQHWLTTTDTTAFKIHFFKNPNNPLSEKIIAGLLLLIVFSVVAYLLGRFFLKIVKGFFQGKALYWTIVTLGVTGIITKTADRIPSRLIKAGYDLSAQVVAEIGILEESTEVCLPLLCALAFVQFKKLKNK